MQIPFRVSLALFSTTLFASLNPPPDDPVARLHECIEQRFQARTTFGMSRVLPYRAHGIRQFAPENAAEVNVLTDLRTKGFQVAMLLVGRYALDTASQVGDSARFGLQGPAFITAEPKDLPDFAELLAAGRTALADFATRDGYDIRQGPWTVALRPLRATNTACVACHVAGMAAFHDAGRAPKLGDALGVAMYVYRGPLLRNR